MATETFRCGEFVVRVTDTDGKDDPHFVYRVVVRKGADSYSTRTQGSVAEFRAGVRDRRGAGALVLQELAAAAVDPQEFAILAVGKTEDRERATRLQTANAWIDAAERLGAADAESCRGDSGDIELAGRR